MKPISIHTDYIKLNQFLKWANAVSSGAHANRMILDGLVSVDGEIENKRGKKIFPGNCVEVKGVGSYLVVREGSAGLASNRISPE
jgi:ribosome-associated protein